MRGKTFKHIYNNREIKDLLPQCSDAYPGALQTFLPLGLSSWLKLEQKKRQTSATAAKHFFTSIVHAAAASFWTPSLLLRINSSWWRSLFHCVLNTSTHMIQMLGTRNPFFFFLEVFQKKYRARPLRHRETQQQQLSVWKHGTNKKKLRKQKWKIFLLHPAARKVFHQSF